MIACFVDVVIFLCSGVQGVRMIDDCLLCRCRGLSFVQGGLLG